MAGRKRTPIPDAEWTIQCQLQIGGVNVGTPLEMVFADSYLSKFPPNVDWLIGSRLDEASKALKPKKVRAKK